MPAGFRGGRWVLEVGAGEKRGVLGGRGRPAATACWCECRARAEAQAGERFLLTRANLRRRRAAKWGRRRRRRRSSSGTRAGAGAGGLQPVLQQHRARGVRQRLASMSVPLLSAGVRRASRRNPRQHRHLHQLQLQHRLRLRCQHRPRLRRRRARRRHQLCTRARLSDQRGTVRTSTWQRKLCHNGYRFFAARDSRIFRVARRFGLGPGRRPHQSIVAATDSGALGSAQAPALRCRSPGRQLPSCCSSLYPPQRTERTLTACA